MGATALSEIVVEPLKGVADEGQAHFRRLLEWLAALASLSLEQSGVISLVDLVNREVGGVNVGSEAGLERCPDSAKAIEIDTSEEGVRFDLMGTATTQTVLGVADEAETWSANAF